MPLMPLIEGHNNVINTLVHARLSFGYRNVLLLCIDHRRANVPLKNIWNWKKSQTHDFGIFSDSFRRNKVKSHIIMIFKGSQYLWA